MLRIICVLMVLVKGYEMNPAQHRRINDLIVDLPGLPESSSFNQYSGYLNGIGGNKLHYWFVESEDNPHDDPLVIWFNGGPGCSSLTGLLEENGPFRVKPDGRSLEYNPHRWNKIANMLYIESPAGVGFSYNIQGEYFSNDKLARDNSYVAIKDFLRLFSNFSDNPLYIFGQSYGGIYAPMLSALIVDDPDINFKGFGVGNGYVSHKYIDGSTMNYLYYHGYLGDGKWQAMVNDCCPDANGGFCDFIHCRNGKYLSDMFVVLQNRLNNCYDIGADCKRSRDQEDRPPSAERLDSSSLASRAIGMGYPCVNSTATILYLNDPEVREALHIPRDLPGIKEWYMCVKIFPSANFTLIYSEPWEHAEMAEHFLKVLAKNKRILMYYGESDLICNYLGGRWFAQSLNQTVIKDHSIWYYFNKNGQKQVGGGIDEYQNLIYVSVKGSGHFVPQQSADKAFVLFQNFLSNQTFTSDSFHSHFFTSMEN